MDDERAVREPCAVIQELLAGGWSAADVCRAFAGVADRAGPAVPLLRARGPLPPAGSLVRVRCMVQDVFGPEMFARRLGPVHTVLGASVAYECAGGGSGGESSEEEPHDGGGDSGRGNDDEARLRDTLADRTVLACVRIPGESPWVVHSAESDALCDDDEDAVEEEEEEEEECEASPKRHEAHHHEEEKEEEEEESTEEETGEDDERTEKLPPPPPPPDYLVKVYDDGAWAAEDLRVNGAFEVVGVLECDVALRPPSPAPDEAFPESAAAQHPPALLCPRIHLLACRPLARGTGHAALLPPFAAPPSGASSDAPADASASSVPVPAGMRGSVLAYLAGPLGGDMLAAEYVLHALLARVTARHDGGVTVGALAVALTGVAPAAAALLVRALRALCARVVCVPVTVAALNTRGPLAPYKDYARERLVQTPLQLAAGTVLVLDETRLAPGALTPAGTRNLQHLRELAQWQRVRYDFAYHEAEFAADVPVLALCRAGTSSLVLGSAGSASSASSSASSAVVVPLRMRAAPEAAAPPTPFRTRGTFLAQARLYVCAARELPPDVDGAVVAQVQDDFVAARRAAAQQTGARAVTQDTLHGWMNLARAVARSFGEPCLGAHAWRHMRTLEAERLDRVQPLDSSYSSSSSSPSSL